MIVRTCGIALLALIATQQLKSAKAWEDVVGEFNKLSQKIKCAEQAEILKKFQLQNPIAYNVLLQLKDHGNTVVSQFGTEEINGLTVLKQYNFVQANNIIEPLTLQTLDRSERGTNASQQDVQTALKQLASGAKPSSIDTTVLQELKTRGLVNSNGTLLPAAQAIMTEAPNTCWTKCVACSKKTIKEAWPVMIKIGGVAVTVGLVIATHGALGLLAGVCPNALTWLYQILCPNSQTPQNSADINNAIAAKFDSAVIQKLKDVHLLSSDATISPEQAQVISNLLVASKRNGNTSVRSLQDLLADPNVTQLLDYDLSELTKNAPTQNNAQSPVQNNPAQQHNDEEHSVTFHGIESDEKTNTQNSELVASAVTGAIELIEKL